MKVKLKVFLHTDKETAALAGEQYMFSVFSTKMNYQGSTYTSLAENEVEFEFDDKEAVRMQLDDIEKLKTDIRAEVQNRLDALETMRTRLLALTAPEVAPGVELIESKPATPKGASEEVILATENGLEATQGWVQFYVTYSDGTKLESKYSIVWAADYYEAQKYVYKAAGPFWSKIYDWSTFVARVEHHYSGVDCIVPVAPQNG